MKSSAYHSQVIERGILTSTYKQQIKSGIREMRVKSVSQIKNSLYNRHVKNQSQTIATFQIAVFTIFTLAILL